MIVISQQLVVNSQVYDLPNNPVIGYHNLVTADNVTSDTEDDDYPITNVANVITAQGASWKANAIGAEEVNAKVATSEEIDYVAIARHNFGSANIPITISASTDDGDNYTDVVEETLLPDDAPAILRFNPQAATDIKIYCGAGNDPAQMAVLYIGKLIILPRRLYVGHTPITYGRSQTILNGKSENGEFLGRVILAEQLQTSVNLKNFSPLWYRETMDPFIVASKSAPFFFAWRPQDYPLETGFAWMTNNPRPVNQRNNGMMEISLEMAGIAS